MFAIENLRKSFAAPGNITVTAVDGVSLAIETGNLVTLLGPSGCGKTTTLRCLAGLERPEAGKIVIGDKIVFDAAKGVFVPPSDRGIGMVFQSYAIWPHMTVFENVAFPLRVARDRRYSAAEIKDRVRQALETVRMGGFEARPATQLSGGQQQRLAFARGLVREPQILLLDEPLSNLDAKLREQMRVELKRLQTRLGITTVYVTHDQAEALALSDEIAVFSAGRIVQRGTPQEIYRQPKSQFVADFIGSANFLPGTVREGTDAEGSAAVETPYGLFRCSFARPVATGESVLVSARPEDLALSGEPPPNGVNVLAGKIAHRVFLGEVVDYLVDTGGTEIRVRTKPELDFRIGQAVHVSVAPNKCVGLPA
ncbi:MAG TPA: ABC transporter ATP-binding protein [Xanthobacteraceae bacterium]|jgi:iron(III) transport system ATP-binding protein